MAVFFFCIILTASHFAGIHSWLITVLYSIVMVTMLFYAHGLLLCCIMLVDGHFCVIPFAGHHFMFNLLAMYYVIVGSNCSVTLMVGHLVMLYSWLCYAKALHKLNPAFRGKLCIKMLLSVLIFKVQTNAVATHSENTSTVIDFDPYLWYHNYAWIKDIISILNVFHNYVITKFHRV